MISPCKLKHNIDKHLHKRHFPHGNGHKEAI
jgi:hypothetical protein